MTEIKHDDESILRAELWQAVRERDRNLSIRCPHVAARHQRKINGLCQRLGIDSEEYRPIKENKPIKTETTWTRSKK